MGTRKNSLVLVIMKVLILCSLAVAVLALGASGAEKCAAPMDLLLLVDKSASIKPNQWKLSKSFLRKLAGQFEVSGDQVHASLVLFAKSAHEKFCFTKHMTNAALDKAFEKLGCPECKKGKTVTGKALEYGRTKSFQASCGMRAAVKKVVVVLTDGKSTEDAGYVKEQAEAMHKAAQFVFAIGVGPGKKIDESELRLIASSNDLVYHANNFDALLGITDKIAAKVCEVVKPVVPPPPQPVCLPEGEFGKFLPAGTPLEIGCMSELYKSEGVKYTFYKDGVELASGPESVFIVAPEPETGDYSCKVTVGGKDSLESHGERVTVVEPPTLTADPSGKPVDVGAKVTFTCSDASGIEGLEYVFFKDGEPLGAPSADGVFVVENAAADHVGSYSCISVKIATLESRKSNPEKLTVVGICDVPLDLMLLVDKSASIKEQDFKKVRKFLGQLVGTFPVGKNMVRVGTVIFAIGAHDIFCFNKYDKGADVRQAVENLKCPKCQRGKTGTGAGLQRVRENSFTDECGARKDVQKVVVVLTDGKSTEDETYFKTQCELMKATGAKVLAVGVGPNNKIDVKELKQIASSDSDWFKINDFDKLAAQLESISKKTCELGH